MIKIDNTANIKFIKEIAKSFDCVVNPTIAGDCIYYKLGDGKYAKCYCQPFAVTVEIISPNYGVIDKCYFPFSNYFCVTNHISNGTSWESTPTSGDFENIANAISDYINLFDSPMIFER